MFGPHTFSPHHKKSGHLCIFATSLNTPAISCYQSRDHINNVNQMWLNVVKCFLTKNQTLWSWWNRSVTAVMYDVQISLPMNSVQFPHLKNQLSDTYANTSDTPHASTRRLCTQHIARRSRLNTTTYKPLSVRVSPLNLTPCSFQCETATSHWAEEGDQDEIFSSFSSFVEPHCAKTLCLKLRGTGLHAVSLVLIVIRVL